MSHGARLGAADPVSLPMLVANDQAIKRADKVSYLDQDELMERDSSAHICDCDTCHHNQTTHHKALRPGFEDDTLGLCRLLNI